jgi:hypothetical protein
MPTSRRRHHRAPKPDRRRALELLASCRDTVLTLAILVAIVGESWGESRSPPPKQDEPSQAQQQQAPTDQRGTEQFPLVVQPLPTKKTASEADRDASAASPDGCTEAIMLAHGFTVPQMVALIRAGLATATGERVVAGTRKIEVATVRITEAGRKALAGEVMNGI